MSNKLNKIWLKILNLCNSKYRTKLIQNFEEELILVFIKS